MSESLIRQLRQLSEDVPVPLEQPSEDHILDIEENLLLPVHPQYRQFLLELGDVVYGYLQPATVADPGAHNYLADLTALAWDEGMPREYMVVCEHTDGYYCIVHESGEVQLWRRSSGDFDEDHDQHWDSIWSWVKYVWLPAC